MCKCVPSATHRVMYVMHPIYATTLCLLVHFRTTHTAQSPTSTKWVSQVWITGGHHAKNKEEPNQPSQTSAAGSTSERSAAEAKRTDHAGQDLEDKILQR